MNLTMFQGFEWYLSDDGNYYKDLKSKIKELKSVGINSIWLPPVYKGTGTNDTGYGVYDLYDLGEFDQKGNVRTKYGTLEELEELIEEIHNNDMLVYADVVLNHKAGADFTEKFEAVQVDENDRTKEISEAHEIEAWTGFDFPGRGDEYSKFKWNFQHFSGVDYDQMTEKSGIFRILGRDKGWSLGVSGEKGNFDYLMFANIDHANLDVKNELIAWGRWFVNKLDLDGFRFDALKHIDAVFINEFLGGIKEEVNDGFYFFGEYWDGSSDNMKSYLDSIEHRVDLFDVALHFNMKEASENPDYDLRQIFDNTLVQDLSTEAVTFVDNHDSQPGQSLESFVQSWFKVSAYSLILLREHGYPCVFYGDYYGIEHENAQESLKEEIDKLLYLRENYAYGEEVDYMAESKMIGWVRMGDEEHKGKLAVLISTGDMNTLTMNVGQDQAGKTYIDYMGNNQAEIVIDEEGNGEFQVGPASISCWIEKQ